ncbi:hypothetical protein [Streptomyces sp. NBC_01506]|uniref:hypothetical protein n=1 Tax=Streptomyces sp. NBC_01506 TaxID=2903887 RepID=UPI00387000BA
MAALNATERRLRRMLGELQKAPDIEIFSPRTGEIALTDQDTDAPFAERCLVRFDQISAHWDLEGSGLSGEFCVSHPATALTTKAPPDATELMTPAVRQRYAEFRVLDDHPVSGTGEFAALRIRPETPAPEIWYHASEFRLGGYRMDLDYCQYLEALTLTKGTFGWQYLFCDVSFTDDDFSGIAADLEEMLDVFPELFPDHNYEPLSSRLTERLRRPHRPHSENGDHDTQR